MIAILLCVIFGMVHARPQSPNPAYIVRYDFDLKDSGGFSFNKFEFAFSVATSDGFHHDATAEIENPDTPEEGLAVKGSYSYIGTNGEEYTLEYIADNNGFRPVKKHPPVAVSPSIPSATPIPELPSVQYSSNACSATLCGTGLG